MVSGYSVKRPYTVFVAVVLIIVLGAISFFGMTTDLMPTIELPYIMVITSYPGASPEKVELEVTAPLEAALGTTGGLNSISSSSSDNMSMITLEFVQSTNMDSATIEVSNNIDLVKGALPEMVSSPMFLQISADMMPIMITSVDMGANADVTEVVEYVEQTVIPAFERIGGVASVTASGLSEPKLKIELDESKIQTLNEIASDDLEATLDEAYDELLSAQYSLEDAEDELKSGSSSAQNELASANAGLTNAISTLNALLAEKTTLTADKAAFEGELQMMQFLSSIRSDTDIPMPPIPPSTTPTTITLDGYYTVISNLITDITTVNSSLLVPPTPPPPATSVPITEYNLFNSINETIFFHNDFQTAWKNSISNLQNTPPLTSPLLMLELDKKTLAELQQLENQINDSPTRVAELEAELRNIDTQFMVLNAMEPELQSGLAEAQSGYEAVVGGQMAATTELASAQAQILIGQNSLEEVISDFETTKENALEQMDLTNIITEDMINGILTANNFSMPAGYIEGKEGEFLLKVGDAYNSVEELEQTILMTLDSTGDITVGDVAKVSIDNVSDGSYAKVNGAEGIILEFQKQSTASTTEVTDDIEDVIKTLEGEEQSLRIVPLMNQGDYIDIIINSVLQNLIFGGILAIIVLILFLRSLKPTIIIAFSIPISLLFAITLMYFTDVTLNMISLSGLALGVGMLVDNSIVVIENIYRMRHLGVPARTAAIDGAKQVAGAIAASTLTTVCVFLPIVFTEGISRQLFTDMGLTIAYSLFASLIVALTLVPAMSSLILKNITVQTRKTLFDKLTDLYSKALAFSLKRKSVVIIPVLVLLAVAILGTTVMGTAFMPEMSSTQMSATLSLPSEDKETDIFQLSDQYSTQIQSIEGVAYVGAMGGNSGGMLSMGGGSGVSFYILLEQDSPYDNKAVEKLIYEKTAFLKGEISIQASTMDMSALTGSGIQINLRSNSLDQLISESERIAQILGTVEGIGEVTTGYEDAETEIRVTVNKEKAMRKGLTVAQVYSEIAASLSLETDSTIVNYGDENFPVVISTNEGSSLTVETLPYFSIELETNDSSIDMPEEDDEEEEEDEQDDNFVVLKDIATITEEKTVPSIGRDNLARYNVISATIAEGYNIGLVSREVEQAMARYTPPEGCSIITEGENEMINDTMGDLVLMITLAVVFIYLIMVAQFQSLMSPFIVLFTLPLAFTGGLLFLWICGLELSIISMLGFLVLAGVVVNNGIVFVDYTNQLRENGSPLIDALIETGRSRIRPILMTALTTILAMSTMALGIGQGAEMTQPMAIVTIGGLAYATVLTLFIVPVIYAIIHGKKERKNRGSK